MRKKISAHLQWWRGLSEVKKWNFSINNIRHYSDLTDGEILEIYNRER